MRRGSEVQLRMRRIRRTISALTLLAGAAVASGCGGPGNLAHVANNLQSALISMPGVADAWVYHDESYAEGVVFTVVVDVPTATRSQLIAVADRIAGTRISQISNYTEDVEFWVTPNKPVTVRRESTIDPVQMADDAERIRTIAAHTDGRVDWFRDDDGDTRLSVTESHTPGSDLLSTVRRTVGDGDVTMTVSPAAPSPLTPRMRVSFPLSQQAHTSIERFVDTVPVDVFGMRIDNNGLRVLQAMVPADPAVAEQELSTVIRESRAVSAGPMWLAWYVPSALGGVPMFGGLVEVRDCSTARIHQASLRSNDEEGISLQARLQSMIDTCAMPEQVATEVGQPQVDTGVSPSPPTPLARRQTPASARTVILPAIADLRTSAGNTASHTSPAHAVRRPLPASAPPPAAAVTAIAPAGSGPVSTPGGSPHPATAPHRSTTRTARLGR
ncbi:hypothetical protein H7J51_27460 [Mycobacterium crocinum]|uniref:Uncharacterized protein n=1 Tax=Mycolicibacterium crocinum TaxID=388459 RepID=A0ABY3TQG5_9MYCO|nr:hypothetical protein [Mycolicibacterium crocinum]MCV7219003.1 hypothetical protein [Mycolicibacterium crocinum]ULN43706.1 hypothetical protein MI149_11905 [Mycolicibacterium crocinum]